MRCPGLPQQRSPVPRSLLAAAAAGSLATVSARRSPAAAAAACRDRARAPTVLLLNTDDQQGLLHSLPALADLPTAGMPVAAPTSALPALGWQLPAARAAVAQLLAAGEWLQARMLLASACPPLHGVLPWPATPSPWHDHQHAPLTLVPLFCTAVPA